MNRGSCLACDRADPLTHARGRFVLPGNVIYLDGNSLGARPKGVAERVAKTIEQEWGTGLIRSWNEAGWYESPGRIGAKLAPLLGAAPHQVTVTDTIAMFVLATVLIAAGFAAWRWWKLRQLEPMLAQLAPTDLQITRSEMRGRMLSGMSVKQLWLVVTLSVLAGAANLASGAYALSLGQSGVASIISGVIFVAVGFYYALHLVSRMKAAA